MAKPNSAADTASLEAMIEGLSTHSGDVTTRPPVAKKDIQTSQPATSPPTAPAPATHGPALPPAREATAGMTFEERLADLNKSPLFMTDLEENDDVAALQALAYEGTPLENASDFKDRGNECFRVKQWADAREFYTKGVVLLLAEAKKRKEREELVEKGVKPEEAKGKEPAAAAGEDEEEEEKVDDPAEEAKVLESLYLNRAAAHLELRNYRSCTLDCASVLRLNPTNIKAFYRSARALFAVDRLTEAMDAASRGLALDPTNAPLKAVHGQILARTEALDAKERKERERVDTEKRRERLVKVALAARGIKTRTTDKPPEMEGVSVRLEPDPDDPSSSVVFPAVLLYPCHLQSDLIKGWGEGESVGQHLEYILPLPWDTEREYTVGGVECYMETGSGGLIKVGKKMALLEVLSGGRCEVVDGIARVFVVPRGRSKGWVEEWKAKKGAEKK